MADHAGQYGLTRDWHPEIVNFSLRIRCYFTTNEPSFDIAGNIKQIFIR
jgi:hypothetical protein